MTKKILFAFPEEKVNYESMVEAGKRHLSCSNVFITQENSFAYYKSVVSCEGGRGRPKNHPRIINESSDRNPKNVFDVSVEFGCQQNKQKTYKKLFGFFYTFFAHKRENSPFCVLFSSRIC